MRLRTVVLPIAVLAFTLSTGSTRAQTVRKIEIPVKVSDSAVNAFLASQWSSRGWNSFTGSLGGCNYTITVPAPTVDFDPGAATVGLSVAVSSTNCGGPWSFSLSPTLAIPSGQVTTAQVLFETDDTFYSRQYKLYSDNSFEWHFSTGGYNE